MTPKLSSSPAWHRYDAAGVIKRMQSHESGLSAEEALKRLNGIGPNTLPPRQRTGLLTQIMAYGDIRFNAALLLAATLAALAGRWPDSVIILAVIAAGLLAGFVQTNRTQTLSNSKASSLPERAQVRRDGNRQLIYARDLVPGDIVLLRAGDRVPADIRLISAQDLRVNEEILTGKSGDIAKQIAPLDADLSSGSRVNMVYSGSAISSGSATGIVVATGRKTELGKIDQLLSEVRPRPVPLQAQMNKLGNAFLLLFALSIAFLFLFALVRHRLPLNEALLTLAGQTLAAVPAGLPAITLFMLALGARAMARKKVIVRRLPVTETLGAVTTLLSDKTGVLTMNELTVKALILHNETLRIEGNSYRPEGRFLREKGYDVVEPASHALLRRFVQNVDLCNESALIKTAQGNWEITGEPAAGALKVLAAKASLPKSQARLVDTLPWDAARQYTATRHTIDGAEYILVTGTPEALLALCDFELTLQGPMPLVPEAWRQRMQRYVDEGLQTIASAYRPAGKNLTAISDESLQNGLIFCGVAAMIDPPCPEAVAAIADCHRIGIRVKMLTADRDEAAAAAGRMLNIGDSRAILTGSQLATMSDDELIQAASHCDIFSSVTAQQKLRLVAALQSQGEVVALTGRGMNDAPALKQADVGIAMNDQTSEDSTEAADIKLVDNRFAALVSAIKEGQRIRNNLQKTVRFVLPVCLAQTLLFSLALLTGKMMPLTPLQVLWINIVASFALAVSLAFEPADTLTLNRRAPTAGRSLWEPSLLRHIGFTGVLIMLGALGLEFGLRLHGYTSVFIRVALLQALVTALWLSLLACREPARFSLNIGLLRHRYVWLSSGILLLLQLAISLLPVAGN